MTNVWDDPDLQRNDDYVRWENEGDQIVGEILRVAKHTFEDGKVAPLLVIRTDDGTERTLTAGQVQLATKLAELRPGVGDRIAIVYTRSEKRQGGKTLKHFEVEVKAGTPSVSEPAGVSTSAPAPAKSLL